MDIQFPNCNLRRLSRHITSIIQFDEGSTEFIVSLFTSDQMNDGINRAMASPITRDTINEEINNYIDNTLPEHSENNVYYKIEVNASGKIFYVYAMCLTVVGTDGPNSPEIIQRLYTFIKNTDTDTIERKLNECVMGENNSILSKTFYMYTPNFNLECTKVGPHIAPDGPVSTTTDYGKGFSRDVFNVKIRTIDGTYGVDGSIDLPSGFANKIRSLTVTHVRAHYNTVDETVELRIPNTFTHVTNCYDQVNNLFTNTTKYYPEKHINDRDIYDKLASGGVDCGNVTDTIVRSMTHSVTSNLINNILTPGAYAFKLRYPLFKMIVEAEILANVDGIIAMCNNDHHKNQAALNVNKIIPSDISVDHVEFLNNAGDWVTINTVDNVAIIADSGNSGNTQVGSDIVARLTLPTIRGCRTTSTGVGGENRSCGEYVNVQFRFKNNSPYYTGKEYSLFAPVSTEPENLKGTFLLGQSLGLDMLFRDGYTIKYRHDYNSIEQREMTTFDERARRGLEELNEKFERFNEGLTHIIGITDNDAFITRVVDFAMAFVLDYIDPNASAYRYLRYVSTHTAPIAVTVYGKLRDILMRINNASDRLSEISQNSRRDTAIAQLTQMKVFLDRERDDR